MTKVVSFNLSLVSRGIFFVKKNKLNDNITESFFRWKINARYYGYSSHGNADRSNDFHWRYNRLGRRNCHEFLRLRHSKRKIKVNITLTHTHERIQKAKNLQNKAQKKEKKRTSWIIISVLSTAITQYIFLDKSGAVKI